MATIDVILFDLGNVLIHIDVLNFPRNLGYSDPTLLAPIATKIYNLQQDYEAGRITTDVFFERVAQLLPQPVPREEIERAFASILCEPIVGMEEIVRAVSRTYRTALVSNTSEFHYRQSVQKVPALQYLGNHYVSYQLNALKPNREFYEAVLTDLQCKPESVVFIDDTEQNVRGAEKLGMIGIRFTSREQLLNDFKTLGVSL